MKLTILFLLLALKVGAQTNGQPFLTWQYNSNALAQADLSAGYTTSFIIYGTNAIGADPWPVLLNKPWKRYTITKFNGVNYTFKATMAQPVGVFYYKVTSSNFWGESIVSNTSSTPATATPPNVQFHEK